MKTIEEKAVEYFSNGMNCAQSVFCAYSEKLNIDVEFAANVSLGFGGGMGRMQETCGAVTGAIMVLSFYTANKYSDNLIRKDTAYPMIREFNKIFLEKNGSNNCKQLLDCDFGTPEGLQKMKDLNLHKNICEKCILSSISILNGMIE